LEFAASLPAGEIATPVARFTEVCLAARFGGRSVETSRLIGLLDEIKSSLRAPSRGGSRFHRTEQK
jgi:hypothetical protein